VSEIASEIDGGLISPSEVAGVKPLNGGAVRLQSERWHAAADEFD
jgi:hypothetical protein